MPPNVPLWAPQYFPAGLCRFSFFKWFKIIKLLESRQKTRAMREACRVLGRKYVWSTMAWFLLSTKAIKKKIKAVLMQKVLTFLEYNVTKMEIRIHMFGWETARIQ